MAELAARSPHDRKVVGSNLARFQIWFDLSGNCSASFSHVMINNNSWMITANSIQTFVCFEKIHSGRTTKRSVNTSSDFADNGVATRPRSKDAMATIPKNEGIGCPGFDAEWIGCHTSCRRWPKSQILIITAVTALVLWAERIDYNWEFNSIQSLEQKTSIFCRSGASCTKLFLSHLRETLSEGCKHVFFEVSIRHNSILFYFKIPWRHIFSKPLN